MNSHYNIVANNQRECSNLAVTSKSIGFFVNKGPKKSCFSLRRKGCKIPIVNFDL
jgi:hypothetical protein